MKIFIPTNSPDTYKLKSERTRINIHMYDSKHLHIYVTSRFLLCITGGSFEVFNGSRQVKSKDNK